MYTTQARMKLFDSAVHGADAELFLVEGDSAARSVATLRDERTQAVLPLQGKPLNAWKATATKVQASPLYRQLSDALGTRDATTAAPRAAEGLRFGQVLLLFDPDADGVHICALMLLYFKRWMPELLDAGRVLVARAPMFSLSHPQMPDPVHAWSGDHAQALLARLRTEGFDDVDLHRYVGLGEHPARGPGDDLHRSADAFPAHGGRGGHRRDHAGVRHPPARSGVASLVACGATHGEPRAFASIVRVASQPTASAAMAINANTQAKPATQLRLRNRGLSAR